MYILFLPLGLDHQGQRASGKDTSFLIKEDPPHPAKFSYSLNTWLGRKKNPDRRIISKMKQGINEYPFSTGIFPTIPG
jgi:hypothetical protein